MKELHGKREKDGYKSPCAFIDGKADRQRPLPNQWRGPWIMNFDRYFAALQWLPKYPRAV